VSETPLVSVVILVMQDAARLQRCLDSIVSSTTVDHELIVVANGLDARDADQLANREDIVLLRLGVNVGYGRGCNLGAALARGRYLALLNDDATVEAGWLESLLATIKSDSTVGAVGSRVLFPDGRLQDAGGVLWRDGVSNRVGHGLAPEDPESHAALRDVDYCSGCSLLLNMDTWRALGGFDEEYFPAYYEDADLCMKIRHAGLRVVYQPRSTVRHEEWGSTSPAWRQFISERNRRRLVSKWASDLALHDSRPFEDVGLAVEKAVQRARGRPRRSLVVAGDGAAHASLHTMLLALARTDAVVLCASAGIAKALVSRYGDDLSDAGVEMVTGEAAAVLGRRHLPFDRVLLTGNAPWTPVDEHGLRADHATRQVIDPATWSEPRTAAEITP